MNVKLLAITPDAEKLIEEAGRTAYLSFDKKTGDSYKKFIRMLVKSGHHSVLEHAYATFRITGGSRAFTHQMVRHRLMAITQQSQRYCNEDNFKIIIPDSIAKNENANILFTNITKAIKNTYKRLQEIGIKKQDARFVLPNACESEIVISANFRELRHIFKERCVKAAQWEIRAIAMGMLYHMKCEAPIVFEDFFIQDKSATILKS